MEIEDIAKIDFFLRTANNKNHLLEIESLIIGDSDSNSITKFKEAAYKLNELKSSQFPKELHDTWQNLFNKQVKYSVVRAKDIRKKSD